MKKMLILPMMVMLLAIAVLPGQAMAAEAYPQELVELKQQLKKDLSSNSSYVTCQQNLVPVYDLELLEFFKYLEETFENKSANSSLTNLAIARYSRFKYRLNETFLRLRPESDGSDTKTYLAALSNYNFCVKITNSYVDLAKKKLVEYVKTKNSQKRSTILLEKYKAISERLREMNLAIAQTYSYYVALNNKLPGFLRQCVTN